MYDYLLQRSTKPTKTLRIDRLKHPYEADRSTHLSATDQKIRVNRARLTVYIDNTPGLIIGGRQNNLFEAGTYIINVCKNRFIVYIYIYIYIYCILYILHIWIFVWRHWRRLL